MLSGQLAVSQAHFTKLGEKCLPAFLSRDRVMRQEVAAVEIPFRQQVGHALNRRKIKIAIAIDHANLGADDLEIDHHCVEWTD